MEQIVDLFFVHKQVTVARYPELVTARHLHSREQVTDVRVDNRRQEDEIVWPLGAVFRQAYQSGQRSRCLDDRRPARTPEGVLAFQRHHEIKTLVENAGEGVRRVQSQGTQHREQLLAEKILQPAFRSRTPMRAANKTNVLFFQLRNQLLVENPVLFVDDLVGLFADLAHHLGRREIIGPRLH